MRTSEPAADMAPFKELANLLVRCLPGLCNDGIVPVTSNNRHAITNSTPLVTKTITIPIASLCNSDEMSARGMRRTSTASSMRCEDGMSDSEVLRPVQESDISRGRSHRFGIPDFVPPFAKSSDVILLPIELLDENMRGHEHKHNEAPNIEQTRKIYQEKEEKKSQANSVTYHESQPAKTADPTSDFLPTARSADPGDFAKQEKMARIRDLRIDAHRARFNSHLKAVRGVEHTSPVVVDRERFDERGRIDNIKNGRTDVYRAQFSGQVQAAKPVEQPSPIVSRDQVNEQEQAPIEYAKTKRVGVPKGPSDRHTRRAPRVVEIWNPSPLVGRESIDEQALIEANEKLYHCAKIARADIRRDVQRAEDAGRLLARTADQVPRKLPRETKAKKPDDGAVVDAVAGVPNAKEVDDCVVPIAAAEQLKTEKTVVGGISVIAPENAINEKVNNFDDDLSDYDVVESDVPGGSSFLAENDWMVVAKEDGF